MIIFVAVLPQQAGYRLRDDEVQILCELDDKNRTRWTGMGPLVSCSVKAELLHC